MTPRARVAAALTPDDGARCPMPKESDA